MLTFSGTQLRLGSMEEPFNPPKWLDVILPAAIVLLAILFDLLASIPYPRVFHTTWHRISSPFLNFLTVDDLLEPVDRTPKFSQRKSHVLTALASIGFLGWLVCLMVGIWGENKHFAIRSLVFSVCWVSEGMIFLVLWQQYQLWSQCYIALKLAIRPPLTPPYFDITFAITSVLFYLLAFGNDVAAANGWRAALLDVIAMLVPSLFAWLAGTLPLKTYLPCSNVAGPEDVSLSPILTSLDTQGLGL